MSGKYTCNFAEGIDDYIKYKCSLGYSESTYSGELKRFDRFCAESYPSETAISEEIVHKWIAKRESEGINGNIHRMIIMKGFLDFFYLKNPGTYRIPDGFIKQYKPYRPYLYNDEELVLIFYAADTIPPSRQAVDRDVISPVIFRLLFFCGLRPQEVLKIQCCDVDTSRGTLYIADSKVHKDRIVAMSADMNGLCKKYDNIMESRIPSRTYFFQRADGKPYNIQWLERLFKTLILYSGLTFTDNKPRVYDFRHNFATKVIQKWTAEGRDVTCLLPVLSAYMGHTSLEDTAYYVHLIPSHLEKNHMNEWDGIPEVPGYED